MRRRGKVPVARRQQRACLSSGLAALLTLTLASSSGAETTIDTTAGWDGSQFISAWGVPNTATYGQLITPNANEIRLNSFTFYIKNISGASTPPQYQAFVYQWDSVNNRITGAPLYSSALMLAPGDNAAFVPITITTGGTPLAANQQYVLFLTTSTVSGQQSSSYRWAAVNDTYAGGAFVYMNNGTVFADLSSNAWNANFSNLDLVFIASFGPSILTSVINQGNTVALGAAGVLDSHANLAALFSGLATEQAVSDAVSQTLPLLIGGSTMATQNALSSINHIVQTRIENKRGLASGDDVYSNRNVWVKPFGSWGDQDSRNGVSGYETETYGLVGGIDGDIAPAFQLGGALAYAKIDIDGDATLASQSADIDVFEIIGYGNYQINDRTNFTFQAGFGHNSNEGRRQIDFVSAIASSDYDGQTYHVGVGLDRTWALGKKTSLIPSVSADYIRVDEEEYTETGAGLLNLTVDGRTSEAMILGADAKLLHACTDQLSLFGTVGAGYDMINDQAMIASAFAGAPTVVFTTRGIDPSPWLVQGGVGAVFKIKNNLELTGRYDADYRSDYLNQTASMKLSWLF